MEPSHGFQALLTQINGGVMYGNILQNFINENKVFDISIRIEIRSAFSVMTYKEWH